MCTLWLTHSTEIEGLLSAQINVTIQNKVYQITKSRLNSINCFSLNLLKLGSNNRPLHIGNYEIVDNDLAYILHCTVNNSSSKTSSQREHRLLLAKLTKIAVPSFVGYCKLSTVDVRKLTTITNFNCDK